jgi:phenylacetaldehyde dehydrogenase
MGMTVPEMKNEQSRLSTTTRKFLAQEHRMTIGGVEALALSGKVLDVRDPTSGEVIGKVPDAGPEDVDLAVRAARRALEEGPWQRMKPVERERLMLRLADLLQDSAEEFAEIESLNSGRTVPNTRAFDVDLSVDYLRYMAGWATKIHGHTFSPSVPYVPSVDFFSYTIRDPVGVVGAITPWNEPLGQAIWKIAPLHATGCTMVFNPAEQTPKTPLRIAELIPEAGIPDRVIKHVTGYG